MLKEIRGLRDFKGKEKLLGSFICALPTTGLRKLGSVGEIIPHLLNVLTSVLK